MITRQNIDVTQIYHFFCPSRVIQITTNASRSVLLLLSAKTSDNIVNASVVSAVFSYVRQFSPGSPAGQGGTAAGLRGQAPTAATDDQVTGA
jgi:hypothetical protein